MYSGLTGSPEIVSNRPSRSGAPHEGLAPPALEALARLPLGRDCHLAKSTWGQSAQVALPVRPQAGVSARPQETALGAPHAAPSACRPSASDAAREGGAGYRDPRREPAAQAIEAQHLPAFGPRDACELLVGVYRHRVADEPQHGQVRFGVRVGVGGFEVDALLLGELRYRLSLARAVDEEARRAAREDTVLDLGELRSDAAIEASARARASRRARALRP